MAFLTALMQMKQPVLTDKNGISVIEGIFKIVILVLGTFGYTSRYFLSLMILFKTLWQDQVLQSVYIILCTY